MKCNKCGRENGEGFVFCRQCGMPAGWKPEEEKQQAEKQENPITAELKLIFGGNKNEKEKAQQAGDKERIIEEKKKTEPAILVQPAPKINLRIIPLAVFVLGFIFAMAAQGQMYNGKQGIKSGIILMLLSGAMFVAADIIRKKEKQNDIVPHEMIEVKEKEKPEISLKLEIFLFLIMLSVAVFFRVYLAGSVPGGFFYDEATLSEAARTMIKDGTMYGAKYPVYIAHDIKYSTYLIYVIAAFFNFFGPGVMQERAVLMVCGILGTVSFYFLARSMFGARVAFIAGLLFASMRWHVTFSRIGFYAAFGVLLGIICMYAAWNVYKNRRLSDFMLFGLAAALVPYGYTPGRMVLAALLVFMAYLLVKDLSFYKENVKKIIFAAVLFAFVFAPLGSYFLKNRQEFMSRNDQVSILNKKVVDNWYQGKFSVKDAVIYTWKSTFLMFNHRGDANPRHNLPGYPMLDPYTAALAAMGLLFAFYKIWKQKYMFLVLLFFMTLVPGLFTIETPQAHRVVFVTPVIIMLASIPIKKYFEFAGLEESLGLKKFLILLPVIFIAVLAAADNYRVYFKMQAKDQSGWEAFNGMERAAAELLVKKGKNYTGIIEPRFKGNGFDFLMKINGMQNYWIFSEGGTIPIPNPQPGMNYIYILQPDQQLTVDGVLAKIYPNGLKGMIMDGANGTYLEAYTFEVSSDEAMARKDAKIKNGLTAEYFEGISWTPPAKAKRVDPMIRFRWHIAPVMGNFSARWAGRIKALQSGNYRFITRSNNYNVLFVSGKKVIENFAVDGETGAEGVIYLPKGEHSIELRYYDNIGHPAISLSWQPPWMKAEETVPYDALVPAE